MIDLFQLAAERIHKVPTGWKWAVLDSHGKPEGFIEVWGAVPVGVYSRGPRKGRPKFPPQTQWTRIWVQKSELDRVATEWEHENCSCHKCEGQGLMRVGWSKEHGEKLATCRLCGGDGRPRLKQEGRK